MEIEEFLQKTKNSALKSTKKQRFVAGFVVLVLLAGLVVFINPKKKLLEMRNSQRRSDVVNILNAVYQYTSDNNGELPQTITGTPTMICKTKASSCDGLVDLSQVLETEKKLLSKMPIDPREKNENSSGYQISRQANGRISVSAPLAENGAVITLSK